MQDKSDNRFLPTGQRAATASWLIPVGVILLSFVFNNIKPGENAGLRTMAIAFIAVFVMLLVSGIVLAISALRSMKTFGKRGILVRSSIGLLFNVLLLAALGAGFALPLTGGLDGKWSTYEDPSQSFTVEMRGKIESNTKSIPVAGGASPLLLHQCEANSMRGKAFMSAEKVVLPTEMLNDSPDRIVDSSVDNVLHFFNATTTRRTTLDGGDLHVLIEGKTANPAGRIKIVTRRDGAVIYTLVYVADDGAWQEEDATRFFDSFTRH